jgi:hypothetical protein
VKIWQSIIVCTTYLRKLSLGLFVLLATNTCFCDTTFVLFALAKLTFWNKLSKSFVSISKEENMDIHCTLYFSNIPGGAHPARAPPLKLEKIRFFGVKSWFFTRNTPKMFAPPSARHNFFKCASPPNLKSWICPCILFIYFLIDIFPQVFAHFNLQKMLIYCVKNICYHSKLLKIFPNIFLVNLEIRFSTVMLTYIVV